MSKEVMAQQLFDNGDVNQVDPDTFVCHGSNGNQYQIKRETNPAYNYEFYCKCPAWKFDSSRKCKHVIAVQLFEQNNNQMKPSKLSKQPSHTHTVSKAKPKATLRSKAKTKSTYKIKKDGNKNTMDWTEPDGSKTKFQFDSEGNLIGKVSK